MRERATSALAIDRAGARASNASRRVLPLERSDNFEWMVGFGTASD
jgi:hypothetical protein